MYGFLVQLIEKLGGTFFEVSGNLWKALSTSMAHVSIEISIDLCQKSYPDIPLKKNCCNLNLDESLWIVTIFLFPDSGLNPLDGFDFYFDMA